MLPMVDSFEEDLEQRDEFWKYEWELRLRTAGLTHYEFKVLRSLPSCGLDQMRVLHCLGGLEIPVEDVNSQHRVQNLMVLDRSVLEACRAYGTEQVHVPPDKYQWSLLKLKCMHQDQLIPQEVKKGCHCLAETQFKPWGCGCAELVTTSLSIQNCLHCAGCLRCYG